MALKVHKALSSPLSPSLLYIGNDLVDLTCLSPRMKRLDKSYLNKVCTLREQKEIHSSRNPVQRLATYWAIKEAAYKAYVQQTGHQFFGPKALEVHTFLSEEEGYVNTPKGQLFFKLDQLPTYIHAICILPSQIKNKWSSRVVSLNDPFQQNRSQSLKHIALRHLANALNLPVSSLCIQANTSHVPELYISQRRIPISLSFSHDGNWGAYAFMDSSPLPQVVE